MDESLNKRPSAYWLREYLNRLNKKGPDGGGVGVS